MISTLFNYRLCHLHNRCTQYYTQCRKQQSQHPHSCSVRGLKSVWGGYFTIASAWPQRGSAYLLTAGPSICNGPPRSLHRDRYNVQKMFPCKLNIHRTWQDLLLPQWPKRAQGMGQHPGGQIIIPGMALTRLHWVRKDVFSPVASHDIFLAPFIHKCWC